MMRLVRWKEGRCSDRHCDLPRPLESADRLASPPIRHARVDEARLDVSMTKVILYEVDRLTCVETSRRCVAIECRMQCTCLRLRGRSASVA